MIFFFVISLFITATYTFIGWRLITGLPLQTGTKAALWVLLIMLAWQIPLSFLIRFQFPDWSGSDMLAWMAYLSFGFFTVLATLVALKETGYLFWLAGIKLSHSSHTLVDPGRRQFLNNSLNGIATGVALLASGYGFWRARYTFRIEKPVIKVPGLHPDLDGLKIAQISDIHIGPTLKGNFMQRIVNQVNSFQADLVAITGDLVDGPVSHLRAHTSLLTGLQSRYGSFFVHGNHEFYSGFRSWESELRKLGIQVLNNEHQIIRHNKARLLVGGVTDSHAFAALPEMKSDPHRAIQNAKATDYRLLLAHRPDSVEEAARAGFQLQLSGHTHGGQYFPGNILIYLFHRYIKGLYRHDNTHLYVNRGTGYWGPPLRLGAPPEITLLTLQRI